jgi:NAD+ diphosphatase
VVHRDSLVMTQGADGPRALLTLDEARKLGANPGTIFLGLHEGGAIFGMGIAAAAAEDLMGRPDVSVENLRAVAASGGARA